MNVNESASNYVNEKIISNEMNNSAIPENNNFQSGNPIINFIKSPTGQGSISSYDEHPLNFKNNHFLSQIIRGLTGLICNLDLALVDIIVGSVGFFKDVKNV